MNKELSKPNQSEVFWSLVNNPLSRTQLHLPNLLDENDKEMRDDKLKLDLLLKTFLSPPQPTNVSQETQRHYEEVEKEANLIKTELTQPEYHRVKKDSILNKPITLREITGVINKLENNKAQWPTFFLKNYQKTH